MIDNNFKTLLQQAGYTSYYDPLENDKKARNEMLRHYLLKNIHYDYFSSKSIPTHTIQKIVVNGDSYDNPILYRFKIVVSKNMDRYVYRFYVFLDKNYNFRYIDAPRIFNIHHCWTDSYICDAHYYDYDYDLEKFTGKTGLFSQQFLEDLIQ